ncbi:MAG: ABC transporter permease [Thermoleophilia bacterium]|nr:ABC transporter permease [Thermoleophilia bacterium]
MTAAELRAIERRAMLALAGRETRRVLALWTQTIAPPVATALLFLAVFGGALGSRLRDADGTDYLSFILPGLLVMTVAGQAFANNSTSLFQAKSEGYVEDVLTSPMRHWQLALGYVTGGLLRGGVAALLVAAVAAPFSGGPADPLLALVALLSTGSVFAVLGVITGMWAESFDQHAFVANLLITPLALLGGVFYSAASLAQPWETLTRLDPLFYLVDATRAGFTGEHETPVWLSLGVAGLAAVAAFAALVSLIGRGWRLKP